MAGLAEGYTSLVMSGGAVHKCIIVRGGKIDAIVVVPGAGVIEESIII